MTGLKICTFRRAICARRSRRMSSSLFPLNMLPTMTSIQPWLSCCLTTSTLDLSHHEVQDRNHEGHDDHEGREHHEGHQSNHGSGELTSDLREPLDLRALP